MRLYYSLCCLTALIFTSGHYSTSDILGSFPAISPPEYRCAVFRVSALIHSLNEIHTLNFLLKDTAVEQNEPS